MTQQMALVDQVSMSVSELRKEVARVTADGRVTPVEKRLLDEDCGEVQLLAKEAALAQRVGFSVARTRHCDKNLITMLKSLNSEKEEAAIGWNPTTANVPVTELVKAA